MLSSHLYRVFVVKSWKLVISSKNQNDCHVNSFGKTITFPLVLHYNSFTKIEHMPTTFI